LKDDDLQALTQQLLDAEGGGGNQAAMEDQISQLIASEKKLDTTEKKATVDAPGGNSVDQFTYANIDAVMTQHLHLNLEVDFNTQSLGGFVEHTFLIEKPTDKIVLDTQGMEVSAASFEFQEKEHGLHFELGESKEGFGAPLTVQLPQKVDKGKELKLKIFYKTTADAVAFSWLKPEQTLGKKMPYLFTQCQFLACRSVAPL
jgi:leukotriene-A4 hydrolase